MMIVIIRHVVAISISERRCTLRNCTNVQNVVR